MSCLTPSLRSLMLIEQFLDIEEEYISPTNKTALKTMKSDKLEKKNQTKWTVQDRLCKVL